MKHSIYVYPWDIIDYGIGPFVDYMCDLGVDQISVAVNYHTAKITLPHNPERSLYFTEPGALYFAPDDSQYGRLKPYESSLTARTSFFPDLLKTAGEAGLDVIAWIVCMHNSRMGFANPDITVLNARGDRLLHTFCPLNPDAAAYVSGIAADLAAHHPITAVELESASFMGFQHGYHHEISGIPISPSLDFLLSLCFCEHCRENAANNGIDLERLRVIVNELIQREFEAPFFGGHPSRLAESIDCFGELVNWRIEAITSLVSSIKTESCPEKEVIAIPTVFPPNADARFINGADPVRLLDVTDTVSISGYFAEPADLEKDLNIMRNSGLTFERCRAGIRPQYPDCADKRNFEDKIDILRHSGFSAVAMYNFGTMRKSTLDWIRGIHE